MNVKNKRCIRNLSHKQLKASKTRNLIAVFARLLCQRCCLHRYSRLHFPSMMAFSNPTFVNAAVGAMAPQISDRGAV